MGLKKRVKYFRYYTKKFCLFILCAAQIHAPCLIVASRFFLEPKNLYQNLLRVLQKQQLNQHGKCPKASGQKRI